MSSCSGTNTHLQRVTLGGSLPSGGQGPGLAMGGRLTVGVREETQCEDARVRAEQGHWSVPAGSSRGSRHSKTFIYGARCSQRPFLQRAWGAPLRN